MSSIEEEPKSDALMGDMSSLDGASGGLGDIRDSLDSKPRSGEGDVSGDDDLEMLRMEREMRSLKDEERQLTIASEKDTMRRQLEMQRQNVQNLRGTTSVLISGSGTKTEKSKSKVPVSHDISSGREKDDDCEIDELTIQQLRADDKHIIFYKSTPVLRSLLVPFFRGIHNLVKVIFHTKRDCS